MVVPLMAGKPSVDSADQVWRRKRPPWTHSPRDGPLALAPRGRPALGLIVMVKSQSPAYRPSGASSGTPAAGPAGSAAPPNRAAARSTVAAAAMRVIMDRALLSAHLVVRRAARAGGFHSHAPSSRRTTMSW